MEHPVQLLRVVVRHLARPRRRVYADDLHLVSHQTGMHPILSPQSRGTRQNVPIRRSWPPRVGCTWRTTRAAIELAYENADTVRLRGQGSGCSIRAAASALTPFTGTYLYRDPVDGFLVFTIYQTGRRYRVTVLAGTVGDAVGDDRPAPASAR